MERMITHMHTHRVNKQKSLIDECAHIKLRMTLTQVHSVAPKRNPATPMDPLLTPSLAASSLRLTDGCCLLPGVYLCDCVLTTCKQLSLCRFQRHLQQNKISLIALPYVTLFQYLQTLLLGTFKFLIKPFKFPI